jgi:hypothetical protein
MRTKESWGTRLKLHCYHCRDNACSKAVSRARFHLLDTRARDLSSLVTFAKIRNISYKVNDKKKGMNGATRNGHVEVGRVVSEEMKGCRDVGVPVVAWVG